MYDSIASFHDIMIIFDNKFTIKFLKMRDVTIFFENDYFNVMENLDFIQDLVFVKAIVNSDKSILLRYF